MITGAGLAIGIQALKTALNLAKEAKDLTDTTAIRAKIIEMQSLIMEAQASAIDAREAHAEQADRIRQLEQEMRDLEAKRSERARYELKQIAYGAFAYMLKVEARGTEPPHWACQPCMEDGKKSLLQKLQFAGGEYKCPRCNGKIVGKGAPVWIEGPDAPN